MSGSMMNGGMMMPKCTAATGPIVWWTASTKTYHMKGTPMYGKSSGKYVCKATAMHAGGKMAAMTHSNGSMGNGSMGHGSMGTGGNMGSPMTMGPRPASSAPGAMGSASGNQGNTGAPGAGGQVPNNPGSTSNNNPSPSPHP